MLVTYESDECVYFSGTLSLVHPSFFLYRGFHFLSVRIRVHWFMYVCVCVCGAKFGVESAE